MSRRRTATRVNIEAFAVQLAPVLAAAHARLDRAGVSPAPPHTPWDQWRLEQLAPCPSNERTVA